MADFLNPSFEVAGTSPGEAADWSWKTYEGVPDPWAEFNASAISELPWRSQMELFEARHAIAPSLYYADAATRLAAGPFDEDEIGAVARQADDSSLWILTAADPAAWSALDAFNEASPKALEDATTAKALFNAAAATYQTTQESFEFWDGLPYLDPVGYARQDELGVGFRNWYETLLTAGLPSYVLSYPLAQEGFIDGWVLPLDLICSGAPSGVLRGAALTFPLTIRPNQNRLTVLRLTTETVHEIAITCGEYASAAALAADIDATWTAMMGSGPHAAHWSAWQDADAGTSGLAFGVSGTSGLEHCYLCTRARTKDMDARAALGLIGFGPGGAEASFTFPAPSIMVFDTVEATTADDVFLVDLWSRLNFRFLYEPSVDIDENWLIEDDWHPATFGLWDVGGEISYRERWNLQSWFGPDAAYHDDISSMTAVAAAFAGGVGGGSVESFENPAIYWPDYL